jgi:hypothetical protein
MMKKKRKSLRKNAAANEWKELYFQKSAKNSYRKNEMGILGVRLFVFS